MANCNTFPTATQTNVVTSQSLSTSFSVTTSTLSSTVSTFTTTSCLPDAPQSSTICGHSTVITITTTIPGATTTISNPVTVTIPVTRTDVITQFGTSCSSSQQQVVTPPPVTISSSSTLPNGQVTVVTVTESPPPYTSSVSPVPQSTDDTGNSKPANLGAIIGGTVGGVFGIIAIVLVVWFVLKRRRRWDDIFDKDDDPIGGDPGNRFSLTEELEPKPYQYGLVGHTASPSVSSPPNSPPLRPTTQISHDSSQAYGGISLVSRNTSTGSNPYSKSSSNNLAPLHMPMTTSIAPGISPNSMSTSRPSTAGSMQPLTNRPPSAGHGSSPHYQHPQQYNHSRGPSYMGHSNAASMSSPPMQPVWGGMAGANPAPLVHHTSMNSDDFNQRSGSPTSFQEPRRLQIANQRTSVATWDDGSSLASPVASTAPGTSSSGADVHQRDGKGRLVLRNSEPVVVHEDGGRVASGSTPSGSQQPAAGSSNDTSLPPAYSE